MADEKKESKLGTIAKAIGSSLIGALSGAVIMYISPLVNSAIKPPRPVANFSYSLDGASATFNNLSTGGAQGWWDFGDGSALEPFAPSQAAITHRFPGPGNYTVKLALHNSIGEEVERSAPVKIDAANPPAIDDFEVVPVSALRASSKNPSAPATFRISGKLKNADILIWSVDDHPLEMVSDVGSNSFEHYVTFQTYGFKKVRLMAVAGKNKVEKQIDLFIDVPDDDPMILIQQTSDAPSARSMPISVSMPAQFPGASYPFEVSRRVGPGSTIVEASLTPPDEKLVRNASLAISSDRKSFTVTGELLRIRGGAGNPASWFSQVDVKLACGGVMGSKKCEPVAAALQLPGRTMVSLPRKSDRAATGLEWELRRGMDVIYKDTKLPVTQTVRIGDKTYRLSVTPVAGAVQIDAVESGPALPLLNTSSPRQ